MPPFSIFPRIAEIAPLSGIVDGFPDMKPKFSRAMGTNPLEDSTIITDHVVTLPEVLVLETEASTLTNAEGQGPAACMQALRTLANNETPLDIVTEWGPFSQMLLRQAEGGYRGRGGKWRLEFVEILRRGVDDAPLAPGTTSGPAVNRPAVVARGRDALIPASATFPDSASRSAAQAPALSTPAPLNSLFNPF